MFRVSSFALALSLLGAGSVLAAPITFQGSTTGCFDCGTASVPSSTTDTLGHVTFTGTTFGPASTDTQTLFLSNLGSFDPGPGVFDYNPHFFTLGVTFTLPGATSGPVLGDLSGKIANANSNGVIKVDFFDTATLFNYTTADGSGSFKLLLNDIQFHPSDAANTSDYRDHLGRDVHADRQSHRSQGRRGPVGRAGTRQSAAARLRPGRRGAAVPPARVEVDAVVRR